jgi:outer membrane immunogenic protein
MKKIALGVAFAALTALQAVAADMPLKARPLAVDPTYDWSGFYIGASTGGVWATEHRFMPDLPLVGVPPTLFTAHATDWIYGGHAGVQGQWGRFVVGLEAAFNGSDRDMRGNVSVSPPEPFTTLSATTTVTNLFTVGPRVGYAWDRLLVYGTGGYAGAIVQGRYTCTGTDFFAFPGRAPCVINIFGPALSDLNLSGSTYNNGWFAGFGFDYVVYRGMYADAVLGAEYQHFDLERKQAVDCNKVPCAGQPHQGFLHDVNGDIARVRLTFKTHGFGMH